MIMRINKSIEKGLDAFILFLIILNVIAIILESVESIKLLYQAGGCIKSN